METKSKHIERNISRIRKLRDMKEYALEQTITVTNKLCRLLKRKIKFLSDFERKASQ